MSDEVTVSDQKALEEFFATMDDMFHAGRFAEVDVMLQNFDCASMPPVMIVGMLTASSWARQHLPSRAAFVERAELALIDKVGAVRAAGLVNEMRR